MLCVGLCLLSEDVTSANALQILSRKFCHTNCVTIVFFSSQNTEEDEFDTLHQKRDPFQEDMI